MIHAQHMSAHAPVSLHMVDHIRRRLGPESNHRKQVESSCVVYTLTHFSRRSVLHGSGVDYLGLLVNSGDGCFSRCSVAEKTTRGAQRADGRYEKSLNAAVAGLTEAVRDSRCQHRTRVGKPEPYVLGEDFDDWDFTYNGYAGTLDPSYPNLLKAGRQSTTAVVATAPHQHQSATQLYLHTIHKKGARKIVKKAGNNVFEAYRQLCLVYENFRSRRRHGNIRADHDKFGSRVEDAEERLNEFLELV